MYGTAECYLGYLPILLVATRKMVLLPYSSGDRPVSITGTVMGFDPGIELQDPVNQPLSHTAWTRQHTADVFRFLVPFRLVSGCPCLHILQFQGELSVTMFHFHPPHLH